MRIQRYIVWQRTCRNTTATPFAVYVVISQPVIKTRIPLVVSLTTGTDIPKEALITLKLCVGAASMSD